MPNLKPSEELNQTIDGLFALTEHIAEEIAERTAKRQKTFLKIAELTCPYKVGQILTTAQGLGQQGLQVMAITVPKFPHKDNRWALDTFALSKAGEVTRRAVMVEEDLQWGGIVGVM